MHNVDNRKTINNLSSKSFKANKTRNIIAIIAIVLTTILFTSLFTMGIGTVESIQKATMRQSGGDGHAVLKYITNQQFDAVKTHSSIKDIGYAMALCDGVENQQLLKRRAEFWYYDETALELGFIKLYEGTLPIKENEIIADTKTLQFLGVPLKVGEAVTLQLDIRGEKTTRDFVLSGWWESDPTFNVGQIFASKAYTQVHTDELKLTYKTDYSIAGAINAYIMFENSFNLEGKLAKLLNDSGFSNIETQPNYIDNNVNWAYLSTNFGMDAGTFLGLGCGLLLIGFTGYLIIYNIFQISIIKDIRFYGLLKTIGTTSKQIRKIIRRQALTLCVIGIPVGLAIGFFSGKLLVPLLMNNTTYGNANISVSPSPMIFIASAIFAFVTVLISTFKPGRIAGRVSPIEAVRLTGVEQSQKAKNKKTYGTNMFCMAMSNLGRNKKRTALVVISLSLSIVLLNTVFTLSGSIDMDKYVSTFNDTDFLVAHAEYFNNDFTGVQNQTSEQIITQVNNLDGFKEGGRLYGGSSNMFFADNPTGGGLNKNEEGHYYSAVYGLEDLPMQRLQLIDGEFDVEKLLSGNYILEGINVDDNGKPLPETANYKVGDTVTMYNWRATNPNNPDEREYVKHTYTVLGHVAIKTFTNSDRVYWGYTFYLPSQVYTKLVDNPAVMSYAFNVEKENQQAAEAFLKQYTEKIEPVMNYTSKATSTTAFEGMQNTVLLVGGALSGIVCLIGVLNFINAIFTSIVARKKEFAMLQSIGMTTKQLKTMLCFEGLWYASLTGVTALISGVAASTIIVKAICSQMWFLSYSLQISTFIIAIPVLLALGFAIPVVVYSISGKQSIVERLREME